MNAAAQTVPPTLFRDWADARAHGLVLSYVVLGWLGSFALMASHSAVRDILGVLLCVHTMVLAAYLVDEAAHQTVFVSRRGNQWVGEAMTCIASSGCASFERIRHIHIRHHLDRADLVCFDFKDLMRRRPLVRRMLQALEWGYIPAVEIMMHLQVLGAADLCPGTAPAPAAGSVDAGSAPGAPDAACQLVAAGSATVWTCGSD